MGVGAGDGDLDRLAEILAQVKLDEHLRQSVLVFCNLPRHERMLRFSQFRLMNQMDKSSPLGRVYAMLLHDEVARLAVHYLTEE